jgi:N-ethylmaleimide reductase
MSSSVLFAPLNVGALTLKHRIVMAPLTRMRAGQPGNVPQPLNAEYYRQRATDGGLIIAEATQVTDSGQGYPATPGIHSDEQIAGWRSVTSAVHDKGGRIILQLWHVGRISHSSFQSGGALPVAPSAIAASGMSYTATWLQEPYETPRALDIDEIRGIIDAYHRGAHNARAAGFDGVELHAANGYLIEQFLQLRSNKRTDRYGGRIENRARLLLEVTEALIDAVGADRVGVRLSPFGVANDSGEEEPLPLYQYAIGALAKLNLAYLHLIEPRASGTGKADVNRVDAPSASELFRPHWPGVLIAAGGYDGVSASRSVASGQTDAIAFGRLFIANPDLVDRIRIGAPVNAWNRATFYGGLDIGYTDYTALAAIV